MTGLKKGVPLPSLAAIHGAVLLFGFAGLFSRWLELPSPLIVLGRTFFAALILAGTLLAAPGRRRRQTKPSPKIALMMALSGLVLAFHWLAFFESIKASSVAVGLLSFATFPVFVILLEPLVFGERLSAMNGLMALVALLGIFLLFPGRQYGAGSWAGIGWGLASGFSFAVLALFNRHFSQLLPAMQINFYQNLFACLVLLPFWLVKPVGLAGREIALLLVLGVICTAMAHSLFIAGLRRVKARTASLITLLEPVYGIGLAWMLLGERPGLRTVCGGLIILLVALAATLDFDRSRR